MVRELAYEQVDGNNALEDSERSKEHLKACDKLADWRSKKPKEDQSQEKACGLINIWSSGSAEQEHALRHRLQWSPDNINQLRTGNTDLNGFSLWQPAD